MKRFKYKARNKQSKLITGIVEAIDKKQAVSLLRERGLVVINLKLEQSFSTFLKPLFSKVSLSDISNFTRQLATMVSSGLTLVDSLLILENQTEGGLKKSVMEVRREVEGGKSLSDAMESQPQAFDEVYVSLVRAGEAGGVLDKVLVKLAENLERKRNFNSKVKGALMYPIIILIGMIGVMIVMLVFIIPQLSDLYTEFETELPIITTLLIDLSQATIKYWWMLVIIVLGIAFAWKPLNKNPQFKKRLEQLILATPVFGSLWEQIMMTTISRTLSLMVSAGVPIVDSLYLSSKVTNSKLYEEAITNSAKLVEKGFPLAQAFVRQETFPSLLSQMLAVGEETGHVDELLNRISVYYQTESEQRVKNLTSAIEPLILILLGGGVGFIVFAVVMPIYNLTNAL